MIISTQKPLEEIRGELEPYHRLGLIGCGGCAAVCQAGGTKQVEELAKSLADKDIVFTFQIDEPCDRRILARELRRISGRVESVDAALVLACGGGVEAVAAVVSKPVVAGLDTLFPGTIIHSTDYRETCRACGECILNRTASICPRTLCPKDIANGPCSEKLGEQCSVDADSECVWVSITRRKKSLGLPEEPLDFRFAGESRRLTPRRAGKPANRWV